MKRVETIISDEENEALERYCKARNISKSEALRLALRLLLFGVEKPDADIVKYYEKVVPVVFPNVRCSRCGRTLEMGRESVHYVRVDFSDGSSRKYYYCSDCWSEMMADPKQVLKKKRLEIELRELKKLVDRYAKVGLVFQGIDEALKRVDELDSKLRSVIEKSEYVISKLYSQQQISRDDMKLLEELVSRLDFVRRDIKAVRGLLFASFKIVKTVRSLRRREVERYEEGM